MADIEHELERILFTSPRTIPPNVEARIPDPWVAASCLQKAIRRSVLDEAVAAASILLDTAPDKLWRRLVVMALEDVGIGDLETVSLVLWVSGKAAWRRERGGDWHVAHTLIERLCEAPKCRDACEVLVVADCDPALNALRLEYASYTFDRLVDLVLDRQVSIYQRTVAAWYIAGTERFWATNLRPRPGHFGQLLSVYQRIIPDPLVLNVAKLGATRTREAHAVSLPLIALMAEVAHIDHEPACSASISIEGWPSYALDSHTRIGRQAISVFLGRLSSRLKHAISRVPLQERLACLSMAIFRAEGHQVDRRIGYEGSRAILLNAEVAHVSQYGLPASLVRELVEMIQEEIGTLDEARLEVAEKWEI